MTLYGIAEILTRHGGASLTAREVLGMEEMCEAYRYAADGHAGEPGDDAVIATGTLEGCRSAIAAVLRRGTGSDSRDLAISRWDGTGDDIEAYHESDQEGCGGWAIRPARP